MQQYVNTAKRKIMKTTKLILSIALVALATAAMGQRTLLMEQSQPNQNDQVAYFTANASEHSNIDIWRYDTEGGTSKKVSWIVYEAPVVTRTIFVQQAEILYEEDISTEKWMTAPFESSVAEEELHLESWMTSPFKAFQVIKVEEWMLL